MSASSIEIFTEAFVLFMVKWKLFQTSTTRLMTHTGRNVKLDRTNPNIRHICSFVKYIFTRNYLTRISGDKRSGSRQCIMWSREWKELTALVQKVLPVSRMNVMTLSDTLEEK